MKATNIRRKRRLRGLIFITFSLAFLLIIRVGFIQFVQGAELQEMAYVQQTLNRKITPKRGTIYDTTEKNVLAVSSSSETVNITPTNIKKEDKEKVAKALADIFELDYENTLKKVNRNSSIEIITKKEEKKKTDKLRMWMQENNITVGINIDEDTKRYYPYASLASKVIGFTGSDNQGLNGIESKYDDILKGENGKILKITDARGGNIGTESEEYVDAIDGNDLILSIDLTVQSIAEKYLEEACIDNKCSDGGSILIANPKTGDVLAMAEYPNYDLNSPFEINNEELKAIWDSLSSGDKNNALQQMWRNKAVSDTYEPGSIFKLVTASAALEEGITDTDNAR